MHLRHFQVFVSFSWFWNPEPNEKPQRFPRGLGARHAGAGAGVLVLVLVLPRRGGAAVDTGALLHVQNSELTVRCLGHVLKTVSEM